MKQKAFLPLLFLSLFFSLTITNAQVTCGLQDCTLDNPSCPYDILEYGGGTDNYSCYDYVDAALRLHLIDRNGGMRNANGQNYNLTDINAINPMSDSRYLFVSSSANYDIIVWSGHAVLKLSSPQPPNAAYPYFFASKQNNDCPLIKQRMPNFYQTGNLNMTQASYMIFYNATPSTTRSNFNSLGLQGTFSITSVTGLTYLWSWDPYHFKKVAGDQYSGSVTLESICDGCAGGTWSGNVTVKVSGAGMESQGRTYSVPVTHTSPIDPCKGTYTVGSSGTRYSLNTYNSISGTPVNVTLNGGGGNVFTWRLTSGTASWYSYGQSNVSLYADIASGRNASFNVTSSGCNRTIAFSRGSYSSTLKSTSEETSEDASSATQVNSTDLTISVVAGTLFIQGKITEDQAFKVVNVQGMVVKNGILRRDQKEISIQDLKQGIYLLVLPDKSLRFWKE